MRRNTVQQITLSRCAKAWFASRHQQDWTPLPTSSRNILFIKMKKELSNQWKIYIKPRLNPNRSFFDQSETNYGKRRDSLSLKLRQKRQTKEKIRKNTAHTIAPPPKKGACGLTS